jgi:hypothetical protein
MRYLLAVVLHHYFLVGGARPPTVAINVSDYGNEPQTGQEYLQLTPGFEYSCKFA